MKIKKHLRSFAFNTIALKIAAQNIGGVTISGGTNFLMLSGLALTMVNLFVRPLIKLLLLPVNILTLGAFRWIVNVLTLYLVTILVPQLQIKAYAFQGYVYKGFVVPAMDLNTFWVLVLTSLLISLIVSFTYWLIK